MNSSDFFQLVIFIVLLLILAPPIGVWIAKVLKNESHFLTKPLGWLEKLIYKISGINPSQEMNWKEYSISLLLQESKPIQVIFFLHPISWAKSQPEACIPGRQI